MLSLSIQTPSQPKSFFGVSLVAFLRLQIERPERRQRPVPIFAARFFAHVDAQKQSLAVW